jgi:hypothetical protein
MSSVSFPKPWPRKPYKGHRCDMTVGINPDSFAPQLIRCDGDAVETVWSPTAVIREWWVCLEHAELLESEGTAYRNPRRKKS